MRLDRSLAVILSTLLATPWLHAQQQQSLVSAQSGGLKIVVIQGEGARNSIRSRTATAPVVEVRDEADKPVNGAEVVFQLPASGPGGVFNGWMRTQTVRSNSQGQAASSGLTPNQEAGRFNIRVTAQHGGSNASVVIAQTNVNGSGGGGSSKKAWIWIGIIAAAAIGAGVAAAVSGGSETATTPTNPVVIQPGVIGVGGPR